eukprot:365978-Chlamydomonas_euryale.AAC.2
MRRVQSQGHRKRTQLDMALWNKARIQMTVRKVSACKTESRRAAETSQVAYPPRHRKKAARTRTS